MSELDFYKAKAESLYRQIEAINKFFDSEGISSFDESDLEVRIEGLNRMYDDFDSAQTSLEKLNLLELAGDARKDFSESLFKAKSRLTRALNGLRAPSIVNSTAIPKVSEATVTYVTRSSRLPELQLPKFSGAYIDWPDFYEMFKTVVGTNDEMTKVEKFQHLRSCLSGTALDTIRSLEPKDENYQTAIDLLTKRFDNKLLHFQAHVRSIFGLKGVERGSAAGLRELSDKVNSHLRALENMAEPEEIADGLLIHLIASKLDQSAFEKWEEALHTDKFPTWTDMSSFLERRCRMMENVENAMVTRSHSNQVGKTINKSNHTSLISSSNTTYSLSCALCNANDHLILKCPRFLAANPNSRYKEAKRLHLCLNCLRKGHSLQQCKSGHCRHCSSKHHSLLHMDSASNLSTSQPQPVVGTQTHSASSLISTTVTPTPPKASTDQDYVLLATAIVQVQSQSGVFIPCRALLDSASQLNFVTSRLANQLQLKSHRSHIAISGIGNSSLQTASKSIEIMAQSTDACYRASFSAVIMRTITDHQPHFDLDHTEWSIPKNIVLADPLFHKSQRIDLLIGAGMFFDLLCVGQIRIASHLPTLQKTRLGWIVSGGLSKVKEKCSALTALTKEPRVHSETDDLSVVLKLFWEIDSCFGSSSAPSEEDALCEQLFQQHCTRLPSGQYAVRLPIKISLSNLGDSYDRALRRFKSLEVKLAKNPEVKSQYSAFMQEYLDLGHMSLADKQSQAPQFFLPHHCVQKLESTSTKLRVVYDGSAKSTSGFSLNDLLFAGPSIQPKLFNTLIRFRFYRIALCGDICKMYRCVRMSHPDQLLQCILWRDSPDAAIEIYTLDTVTYGTKPAAFLAIRAMHQLSYDEEVQFPVAAKIVRRDFYVDDLISGGDTVEEVAEIRLQVKELLRRGHFPIRKWCSNEPAALDGEPESEQEKSIKFHDGTDITKALGLAWDTKSDKLLFHFSRAVSEGPATKRAILSAIAKLYDPLGLIGPIITRFKTFMQALWKDKLDWDESLPQTLHSVWLEHISQICSVASFKFPRFVMQPSASCQLHAFCDASISAYGACVYVRSEINGSVSSQLLCSKSRVAPLKVLTIPKLELAAAHLLSELICNIVQTIPISCTIYCWSDSTIVLAWIRECSSNYNIFVSNRIAQIQERTKGMTWRHVPSEMNPADILSRGCTPIELIQSSLWCQGPAFLLEDESSWPTSPPAALELPERRRQALISIQHADNSSTCKYQNSFGKMQRVFGYIYRFLLRIRGQAVSRGSLTIEDIKGGSHLLVRSIQLVHFGEDYKALQGGNQLSPKSKLLSLHPFLDTEGLLRVGGRLQNSNLDFDARHPLLLPKGHPVTIALIMHFHQKFLHAGPQFLLSAIYQKFWPIGGRKAIAAVTRKCIRCFRLRPKIFEHIMAPLPADRVQPNRPFLVTGIDFCGPFLCKSEIRSRPPGKCYISIFICFATKATHLEVVEDLSTASFIAALKRFASIRGRPNTIWSDNATNFVGARNQLIELRQLLLGDPQNGEILNACLAMGIKWNFIPPRSPHFGGLWEAAVKSAKYHFVRVVGGHTFTFHELRTLVCEISAILNSRPLCPVSENPDDLDVLTPGHFLIGSSFCAIDEPDITHLDISRLSRWQRVCQMQQVFWRKWSTSYLSLLQERGKWRSSSPNLKLNSVVVLKDDNLPPLQWRLGRVESIITGDDGVVRVATIRTSAGLVKRCVNKIAVLPLESTSVESPAVSNGGSMSGAESDKNQSS